MTIKENCRTRPKIFPSSTPISTTWLVARSLTCADYQDFDGVKFPTKIVQKTGGFPALDLTVTAVQPNAPADIQVPDNVRQAAVRVQTQQVVDGVWYLSGGTHHSVLIEKNDYVVVVEGPQNDDRATAVIEGDRNGLSPKGKAFDRSRCLYATGAQRTLSGAG